MKEPEKKYDICISYASIDNETIDGNKGWITEFVSRIEARIAMLWGKRPTIFFDTQRLHGSNDISVEIEGALRVSKMFLPIISPAYLNSEWCIRELEWYFKNALTTIDQIAPILPVIKHEVDRSQLPSYLQEILQYHLYDGSRLWEWESKEARKRIQDLSSHIVKFLIKQDIQPEKKEAEEKKADLVTLKLDRYIDDGENTFGQLFVDGKYYCHTVEETYREKLIPGKTRIPAGSYDLDFNEFDTKLSLQYRKRYSWFEYHIEVKNVPAFEAVYLLDKKEDADCIALLDQADLSDKTKSKSRKSSILFKNFYTYVKEQISTGKTIKIMVSDESKSVPKDETDEATTSTVLPEPATGVLHRTSIDNDGAYTSEDLLDIENDVRSFALLLASKEVMPPLAVALFGRWGSGKSFFMKHLASRVDELAQHQGFLTPSASQQSESIEEDSFCRGIAQIEFNAWSYLDANLWAGLAHSLFQKLNEYITDRTEGEIQKLKVQVRLTKRLNALYADLQNFKEKKENLQNLKSRLEEEKDKRIANFFAGKYKESLKTFLKKNGISDELLHHLSPAAIYAKVEYGTNIWNYLRRNSLQLFLFVAPLIILLFLGKQWISLNAQSWLSYLQSTWANITTVMLPGLMPLMRFYRSKKRTLKELAGYVSELAGADKHSKHDLKALKLELDEIDPIIHEIEEIIRREYALKSDVTQLAIANFISAKSTQKFYMDRLGIVSIIRKDFETLSDLFYPSVSKEKENDELLIADRQYISEQFGVHKKLERIILYVDDLDRCSDEKVLEVLQAVHLLMAFPLFNVVVGVDKRCVQNALLLKTKLQYLKIAPLNDIKDMGIEMISPREYLEKIFQIPFELREPTNDDLKNLVGKLLKDHIEAPQLDEPKPEDEDPEITDAGADEALNKSELEVAQHSVDSLMEGLDLTSEAQPDPKVLISATSSNLKLTPTEFEYLTEIIFIVGNTPRTVKRFLNIYRVIRAREQWQYTDENRNQVFLFVMFLLAIRIGKYGQNAGEFFKLLEDHSTSQLKTNINKVVAFNDLGLSDMIEKAAKIAPLLNFKPSMLEDHIISFVSRFSFSGDALIDKKD